MKYILIYSFLLVSFAAMANKPELSPFQTDYCTNYPEGTKEEPDLWKHCCLMHDMFFWAGGNKHDRNDSDIELKSCIEKTGAVEQARIMYFAVRAGSYSPIKYPKKRWNHGWRTRPEFQKLTPEDVTEIENELHSGYEYISPYLKLNFINILRSRLD